MRQINSQTGICFFKVAEAANLRTFLLSSNFEPLPIEVNEARVEEWLDYGCVYVNGRRERQDFLLERDQIVRLHTRRKSYWQGSLKAFIVEDNDEFLVLDKPSGLPTHPTLDNYYDNAKVKLERELGAPLFTTHRLDIPTQGLLIIAKSLESQRVLNKSFSLGRVEKIYRSINEGEVAPGHHVHYMNPEGRAPRHVQAEESPGWWKIELEVLGSAKTALGFSHEIKLLTGKTHQIRAQMAFQGAPVIGDELYGAKAAAKFGLECYKLSFTHRSKNYSITRP